jgi:hypothetical protein
VKPGIWDNRNHFFTSFLHLGLFEVAAANTVKSLAQTRGPKEGILGQPRYAWESPTATAATDLSSRWQSTKIPDAPVFAHRTKSCEDSKKVSNGCLVGGIDQDMERRLIEQRKLLILFLNERYSLTQVITARILLSAAVGWCGCSSQAVLLF